MFLLVFIIVGLAVICVAADMSKSTNAPSSQPKRTPAKKPQPGATTLHADGLVEIWQTMDDGKVCSKCAQNYGLTREELKTPITYTFQGKSIQIQREQDIPALCVQEDGIKFGNAGATVCRCYWRAVPRSYHELLKRDPKAARKLDAQGKVKDALFIRDKEGHVIGELSQE